MYGHNEQMVKAWNGANGIRASLQAQHPTAHDLIDLLHFLLTSNKDNLTCDQLLIRVAPQLSIAYTTLLSHSNAVESEYQKELQNGRLFRLLVKMGFVIDRPE